MKMDVSKFKKLSSDKKKTILMHPSGHKIVIAHEALNKENLNQLDRIPVSYEYQPGMSEGGRVAPKESDIFNNNSRAINKRMFGKPPEESPEFIEDDFTGDQVEDLERGNSLQETPLAEEKVRSQNIQSFAGGGAAVAESRDKIGITPQEAAAIDAAPVPSDQASPQNQGVVGAQTPMATPVDDTFMADVNSPPGSPIAPFPAYKAPAGSANDPYAVANQTALKGIQTRGEAAQQMAVASGEAGARAASADAMSADSLNHQRALFEKNYQDLLKERQAQYADWGSGHIDPQRYIKSMTTGDKILTGIGLLLGGMGSGLTHQPNQAFDYLNKQISNDIDAQKASINNKSTLFNANLAQTGDLVNAASLTRMQTLDINAMHLKQIADTAINPIQRAAALDTAGKLHGEASQIQAQIAQRQALMQTAGPGEDNFQQRMRLLKVMGQDKFAEDAEKRHVPGVGNASREVPADVLTQITARNALNESIMDLQNFAKQNSGSLNPAAMAQGKAKAALVQDMVRQASNAGVFKESEKDFMNRYVGEDPTQLFQKYRSGKGYEEVRRNNLVNLNSLKTTYGMPVPEQQKESAQGTPNLQKRGDSTYMKVPGGWKKVK